MVSSKICFSEKKSLIIKAGNKDKKAESSIPAKKIARKIKFFKDKDDKEWTFKVKHIITKKDIKKNMDLYLD